MDSDDKTLGCIPLTDNLHSALLNLRDSPAVPMRTFWIDQICVNQKDKTERNHQVALMGKIYAAATHVLSYLGPGDTYDEHGFRLLERIDEQYKNNYDSLLFHDGWVKTYQHYANPDRIPDELKYKGQVTPFEQYGLCQIVYGPWTRRLWMLQEASWTNGTQAKTLNHFC